MNSRQPEIPSARSLRRRLELSFTWARVKIVGNASSLNLANAFRSNA